MRYDVDMGTAVRLEAAFVGREMLAQPFVDAIVDEGEFSLFYFDGSLSHTILKTPQTDDFRVQEEHGGIITAVTPEEKLVQCGAQVMEALGETPLYARPDFVRTPEGGFALMELELIEPALYFRMDEGSPMRFASAFVRRMGGD